MSEIGSAGWQEKEQGSSGAPDRLEKRIDRWKRELLDTGKRNRMINYKETKRTTLRILEPGATELFNRLAFSEKPLTFQKAISKDTDLRTYAMIALMETLSYDLNVQVGDIKTAGTIIERERTLKNLRAKAKLAQEEQGANILYLCFGFIYWREHSRESSPWLKAPLLLMPVELGLKSLNAPYTLRRHDDEIAVNPTLSYLFSTEYHIDLPAFELKNRFSFDEYFARVEELTDQRGWKVVREVSLGLLSFLKISMYHDLNDHRDRMIAHPVLRAMAGDRAALPDVPAEAEGFDFDARRPDEWHEVVVADSSQEEAILLSKLGVSFVMQGPPGTGKSQTITNIIAEALADGKKVLFVSEKAAALQVVLKRLTEAYLDDFCLSLHNYKANKKEIIDSIGANLSLEEEYEDGSALSELTELFHDRAFLNEYAAELHRPLAPLNESLYQAFGKLSALEKATPVTFALDQPTEITREQHASMVYAVSALERALRAMGGPLRENPWYGTRATSFHQAYREQLLHDTHGLSDGLRRMTSITEGLNRRSGMGLGSTFAEARRMLEAAQVIRSCPGTVSRSWFLPGASGYARVQLREAREHADRLRAHRDAVLTDWQEGVFGLDTERIRANFPEDDPWMAQQGGDLESCLSGAREQAEALRREIVDMLAAYREALDMLSFEQTDTAENIRMVWRVLRLIADAPCMEPFWFDERKNAAQMPLVEDAALHSASISAATAEILRDWEPSALDIDADAMLNRFKTDHVGLFHRFRPGYKEDIRILRTHARAVGANMDEAMAIRFLQRVRDVRREKQWLEQNREALREAAGHQDRGELTDWSRVREGMFAASRIAEQFPYHAVPEATVSALVEITGSQQRLGTVRRLAEALSFGRVNELEAKIRGRIADYTPGASLKERIMPWLDALIDRCGAQVSFAAECRALRKGDTLSYADIPALLRHRTAMQEEQRWLEEHRSACQEALAEAYRGADSDWAAIEKSLDTADRLTALFGAQVPERIIGLFGDPALAAEAFAGTEELTALIGETAPKLAAFEAQFNGGDFEARALCHVADHYDACVNGFAELNKWIDYAETREECDRMGLADFTAKVAAMDMPMADVQAAFERGFCLQWLQGQLERVPAVQSFRRRVHEQCSERFIRLDTRQYEIAQASIRRRIIGTFPKRDQVARAGSELGILRHEMEKKRRIMPLRKLFHSIPNLLLTLKPCLMMSPLSVAYFLEADAYQFDMVIFDEASQIFPQDAIGAIFRAKQVIIAGDTRQLPPTNFFSVSTGNSSEGYDDEEGYDEEVYDSILEEAAHILPSRTLLWHYRSRHEHLIAFSNQEIYHHDLITFPGCGESEPDTGVEFVYVEDGYYEPSPRNANTVEARRMVALVREHIDRHPERSLGIIAFSEKQQQAIALEIQRFREAHAEYEAFFAEGKDEEFFVKNLENVQGDERDTIFFSVGYAKTKEQKANDRPMAMRFGPLGILGGERRLNVAITRAKINVKLVSSILPSDIDLSRTESEGVRMLRAYMEFALNGEATLSSAQRTGRPDAFVDAIADFLREQGFRVRQHVGCSGYRMDIAVRHPLEERFVVGVECDGYAYVSARTARDRDRLRSAVLTGMGWTLYRVWSAEWYQNPEIEGQKLVNFINAAIARGDGQVQEREG